MNENHKINGKLYCAHCKHFEIVKRSLGAYEDGFCLSSVCNKNMERKKSGEPKMYKYYTAYRRTMEECPEFELFSDIKSYCSYIYIKYLRRNFPIRDEKYSRKSPESFKTSDELLFRDESFSYINGAWSKKFNMKNKIEEIERIISQAMILLKKLNQED